MFLNSDLRSDERWSVLCFSVSVSRLGHNGTARISCRPFSHTGCSLWRSILLNAQVDHRISQGSARDQEASNDDATESSTGLGNDVAQVVGAENATMMLLQPTKRIGTNQNA